MKSFNIAMILVATFALTACGRPDAKLLDKLASGGGGSPRPVKQAPQGPSLEGIWSSDCVKDPLARSGWRIIMLAANGNEFEYQQTLYSDARCLQSYKTDKMKGTHSYVKQQANGAFTVEYRSPIDSNRSALRYQNITRENDVVKVSEFGDLESLANEKPEIELKKIGN